MLSSHSRYKGSEMKMFMSFKQYALLLIIGLISIVLSYCFVDVPLAKWSFSLEPFWHSFFKYISDAGKSGLLIISAFLAWLVYRKKSAVIASKFQFIFLSLIFSKVMAQVFKFIFGRMRPSELRESDQYGFMFFETAHSLHSFPSGHVTTAFALFTALSILFPRYFFLWLCFAILMAFARIGVSAHFLSDTIAGMLTGIGSVLLVHLFMQKKGYSQWERNS